MMNNWMMKGESLSTLVEDPASPCVSICVLDEEQICLGCYRSSDEITQWFGASVDDKNEILDNAKKRQQNYEQ